MTNVIFVRNFVSLFVFMTLCVGILGFYIYKSSRELNFTDNWVVHSQSVIIESQEFITSVQAMVASQRGYLLSGDQKFLAIFEMNRNKTSQHLATLSEKLKDNAAQQTRLLELQQRVVTLTDALMGSIQKYENKELDTTKMTIAELQTEERDNILRVAGNILNEEYTLLGRRADILQRRTQQYHYTLFVGTLVSAALLLVLNAFLLSAHSRRNLAEQSLRVAEDRLQLAIRGANDGIFDWDLVTNDLYWSPHYKQLLGYADEELDATIDLFNSVIHPEDKEGLWETFNQYINGDMSEFSHIFRMRHKAGHYIWVHARGKATFNPDGKAERFSGVHTDVTHIKEYEIQLQVAKDNAEKANEAKGEFLAHMSHEIRTPLTTINGVAEIFTHNLSAFDEKQRKLISTLSTSAASLKDLINDILDFSKIESREIELVNEHFLLRDLFAQVITITSARASEKKLDFSFDYASVDDLYFFGDKARLRQVLINLIGNAIKFTDNGYVRVTASLEPIGGGHILNIRIADSGIGISNVSQDVIFEKFRQADSSVSRRYGGTGLGLPISKSLVELMGGQIALESALGMGSIFTVRLPMKEKVTEADRQSGSDIRIHKLNDKLKNTMNGEKRILLVEDYEGNIVVLGYTLESLGCSYDVARTGVEAIDLWKQKFYDLILMDVQMPEMDGLTATQQIRTVEKDQAMEQTPIVGLTAHALIADKEKCIQSGMNDYLSKPIDEAALKKIILKYINKKQPGDESRAA